MGGRANGLIVRPGVSRRPELEIAPSEDPRQLSVAVAQVEDHRERLVFLRVGREEIQQEALAAAGRAEHQRVPDVLDVEVVVVRRLVPRLEDGERLAAAEGRRGPLALVETEEKAEIRTIASPAARGAAGCGRGCRARWPSTR